ncbi:unnamed protein product [Miscanthus lutarioriparius]|uniref:2Fe-2S ferredoxin-type domain-containing protein n=1 Tax=Miscanthus lutarioriparius TaxID=422564 RepID=A0A811SME0_9POAL|nr:unnamed protein product [Miscanthus lutarioriparius]
MAAASASLLHLATPTPTRSTHLSVRLPTSQLRIATAQPPRAYKVTIEHGGESRVVEVEKDETILSRALDEGLDVPHDCKLGVCMTCPARLVSGVVDQSDGMLSDDVVAQGYALLCAAYPRSDMYTPLLLISSTGDRAFLENRYCGMPHCQISCVRIEHFPTFGSILRIISTFSG